MDVNCLLLLTMFSQNRDCDSCTPEGMPLGEDSLCEGFGKELLELRNEHRKDPVQVVDGQSFLEQVEQRVVGMCGRVEMFCLLPFQVSYFFEMWLKDSKIRLLPRLSPRDRCLNSSLLQLLQQIWWNFLVEIQFSLDDTDYSLLCIVEGPLLLSILDETCQVKGHFLA